MKLAHVAVASASLLGISFAIAEVGLQSASPCSTSTCNAVIVLPSGCGGGITVAPEPIRITATSTTITWKVVSPGWTFASNGIEVHQMPKAFTGKQLKAPDTFTWEFKSPQGKVNYKYDINLYHPETKTSCKLDPTIVNY